jgi:hypothetical protein
MYTIGKGDHYRASRLSLLYFLKLFKLIIAPKKE